MSDVLEWVGGCVGACGVPIVMFTMRTGRGWRVEARDCGSSLGMRWEVGMEVGWGTYSRTKAVPRGRCAAEG